MTNDELAAAVSTLSIAGEDISRVAEELRGLLGGIVLRPQLARSGHWPEVRNRHLAQNRFCAACGCTVLASLEVHHIKPVHLFPDLELDPGNLITLCDRPMRSCHFVLGHLGNWSSYNLEVAEDAVHLLDKIRRRP